MNPYLSEKARGEIPRVLKWLRNAGLAFCVFCSVGGLYTLCLSLQDKDYSHIGGYVFWIVVGAVPLALFARGEPAATMQEPSPAGWRATPGRKCFAVAVQQRWYGHKGHCMVFCKPQSGSEPEDRPQADRAPP